MVLPLVKGYTLNLKLQSIVLCVHLRVENCAGTGEKRETGLNELSFVSTNVNKLRTALKEHLGVDISITVWCMYRDRHCHTPLTPTSSSTASCKKVLSFS